MTNITESTEKNILLFSSIATKPSQIHTTAKNTLSRKHFDILSPIRKIVDDIEVNDRLFAHFLCQLIPTQCPFARKIEVFGRTILSIPPLCKLNPFYNEVVSLRFRAMCYLADQCGEDVSSYC